MNRRLVLLLALFVMGVLIHQAVLPPLEFPEEHLHLNYVELLRVENRLPDRAAFLTNSTQRESGQPPLVYWLAGLPLRLLNLPPLDGDAVMRYLESVKNPWYTAANLWNRADNMNFYLHGADERGLSRADIVNAVRVLRLTMIGWGVLAVIGAYGAAREVCAQERWALAATALFAFTPTMIHIHAYFNNDAASVALATLALWRSLVLLRRGAAPARLLAIGTLLALAGLAKVSALLVAPGVGVAVLLDAHRCRLPFGRLILNGLWVGLPVLLLFGPWALYGALTYGDPFGFGTHHIPGFYHDPLLTPAEFIPRLPWVYLTYWGLLGTLVLLNPLTYTLLGSILLLAAGGYAASLHRKAREGRHEITIESLRSSRSLRLDGFSGNRGEQAIVLGAVIVPMFAGLIRWLQEILFIPGRLLYPAHVALVIAATGGLWLLARRFPRLDCPIRLYAVGPVMCAGLILAPAALLQAYTPPRLLSSDDLPALQGEPLDFDGTVRLLGYRRPDATLRAGGLHRITLCWEVLQPTDRLAAYSVKLMRDGIILADRTSVHGLGHYDSSLWRSGDRWCEDVDIRIEQVPLPGQVYDVLVALLDARTQDFDWQAARLDGTAVAFPFIGQAVSPAGDMSNTVAGELTPADITFPGFVNLAGYAVQGVLAAGEMVRLDLLWDVTGQTPDTWSQFVHLIGPSSAAVLADGVPRAGGYPTWAWSVGEWVADSWTFSLPVDLLPGEYTLTLGFYRQDSGERMPVQVGGQSAPDGTAALLRFIVE